MAKVITTILLLFSSLLLVKANVDALRGSDEKTVLADREKGAETAAPLPPSRSYNPRPPRSLPDLYSGYLFNADRHLEGGGAQNAEDGRDEAPHVNIYEVSYDGSLIYGALRQGLVSYPLQKSSRSTRRKTVKGRAPQRATLRLSPGSKIGGYVVTEIEEDHITFQRGGEEVVKSLHDNEKIRSSGSTSRSSVNRPRPRRTRPTASSRTIRRSRTQTPPTGAIKPQQVRRK